MNFEECLKRQFILHPSIQPQDIVKLCYQAAFGAEHLLDDAGAAYRYFETEFQKISCGTDLLYEEISPDVCRVNLWAWKKQGLPKERLFEMFTLSARIQADGAEFFYRYLESAEKLLASVKTSFLTEDWDEFIKFYTSLGLKPVHHSQKYAAAENPSYRIVKSNLLISIF